MINEPHHDGTPGAGDMVLGVPFQTGVGVDYNPIGDDNRTFLGAIRPTPSQELDRQQEDYMKLVSRTLLWVLKSSRN